MDGTPSKVVIFLLVLCGIADYVTGVAIKDPLFKQVITRDKGSPADSISVFGFGIKPSFLVPNPISSSKEILRNIFKSPSILPQNENIYTTQNLNPSTHIPEMKNMNVAINKPDKQFVHINKKSEPVLSPSIDNNKKLDVLIPEIGNYTMNYTRPVVDETKKYNKTVPSMDQSNYKAEAILSLNTETTSETVTSKDTDIKMKIDQSLLDYIFNSDDNNIDATTVDTTETGDYTTETGEYESTTFNDTDYLLRIPAPVVASLLG